MSTVQSTYAAMMNHGLLDRMEYFTSAKKAAKSGMYGWLFPGLAALKANPQSLIDLGTAMRETSQHRQDEDLDSKIPAGFTFLGQFVAHDITFDTTPFPER